jgi:alkylation response protein AidB-like acyl-CoA dehydrogenase
MPVLQISLSFLHVLKTTKTSQAFIVERDKADGMTFGEEEHKLGIHGSSTRQVFFSDQSSC